MKEILGREPNITELGIFSVMWSEHCSYKSSKVHLKRLPTRGKLVVQGPGENAGVVDIGDGLVAAFKIESHNHPSYVEPFQGATTGVGGILRDIFTMGARPVAVLDSLRFGPIAAGNEVTEEEAAKNRRILDGVIRGWTEGVQMMVPGEKRRGPGDGACRRPIDSAERRHPPFRPRPLWKLLRRAHRWR